MSVWLSVHDYSSAKVAVAAGVDALLVGDSLAMTVYGMKSTKKATMKMMLQHTEAVLRAVPKKFPVVADMPIGSYQTTKNTLKNARAFEKIGTKKIKLEGGKEIAEQIQILIQNGFEITGHLGLLPQTAEKMSVVGKKKEDGQKIIDDAALLEKLGVKNIVLECIPAALAKKITNAISIPTIGIGAGNETNGQILVFHDVVGRSDKDFSPTFLRRFGNVFEVEKAAVEDFVDAVKKKDFPNTNEQYS